MDIGVAEEFLRRIPSDISREFAYKYYSSWHLDIAEAWEISNTTVLKLNIIKAVSYREWIRVCCDIAELAVKRAYGTEPSRAADSIKTIRAWLAGKATEDEAVIASEASGEEAAQNIVWNARECASKAASILIPQAESVSTYATISMRDTGHENPYKLIYPLVKALPVPTEDDIMNAWLRAL